MLYEYTGICQHCAEDITGIIHQGKLLEQCHKCKDWPIGFRKIAGLIYVVSNPHQVGVKVGLTTKPIEQRIKGLNSTGVPGSFIPIALFPSDKPKVDEKRVHQKIERYRIEKEHFDLDAIEAVLKAYRALNRKKPIFLDGSLEETFYLKLKQAKIEMQLRLKGKSEKNFKT